MVYFSRYWLGSNESEINQFYGDGSQYRLRRIHHNSSLHTQNEWIKLTVVSIYWSVTLAFHSKFIWKIQWFFFSFFFPMLCLWCIGLSFGFGLWWCLCVCSSKFLSESISFVSQCVRIELKHRQIVVRLKQIYEFTDWESVTHTHLRRIKNTHTRSIMHLYTARIQQQMEAVATANRITNIWCDRTRVACQNRI